MNQLVCGNCGSIHYYSVQRHGDRIHWLQDIWDTCPSCRAKQKEQITSLQARIKVLEAVRDAAECTQEGNLYSSDLYKALKESEVINE